MNQAGGERASKAMGMRGELKAEQQEKVGPGEQGDGMHPSGPRQQLAEPGSPLPSPALLVAPRGHFCVQGPREETVGLDVSRDLWQVLRMGNKNQS